MGLRIVTTTTAERAEEGVRCSAFLRTYYVDDYSSRPCGATAVWVITTEAVHDEMTPAQQRGLKYNNGAQRRFVTRRAYCAGCIPKRHAYRGLALRSRLHAPVEGAVHD